ncbi:MAG: beta strand repeat-containing protein [Candidatus Kapaibacterium sp.]
MRFFKNLVATGLAISIATAVTQAQPVSDPQGDVGIGTIAPHPSAKLDVVSTTGGFLLPRMTEAQRDAIASPANALLIFNTTVNEFQWFDATLPGWTGFGAAGGPFWRLDGNNTSSEWNGAVGMRLGTRNANDLSIVTEQAQNIDFWTNNAQVAILTSGGDLGLNELAPSARLDVVGDNANPAIEATNNGVVGVISTVDGGSGLALGSYPAVYGDGNGETGVAGTSNNGVGVFGASSLNHGVNGLSLGAGVAGVHGRNDVAGGFGVQGISFGPATAVYGSSSTGMSGRFENTNAANTSPVVRVDNNGLGQGMIINDGSPNDGLEINSFGTAGHGIDLNGGEIDGDDRGNALGDGTANQQLTVRGNANAVVGNTLAGNPTVWDLVVQGDAVTTGLFKVGGSLWLDGTSASHRMQSSNPFILNTLAGNITIDANSAPGGQTTINDNMVVTGTSDLQNSIFNSTGNNGGDVFINDNATVQSIFNVNGNTFLNAQLDVDGSSFFHNTITQTGGGQVSFSGNVDALNGLDVSGANLNVDAAVDIIALGGGHTFGTGGVNQTVMTINGVPGSAPYELQVNGDAQITGLLALPTFTTGSVVFAGPGGVMTQDNPNFFWDDVNNRLGVKTNTPNASIQAIGEGAAAPAVRGDNNGGISIAGVNTGLGDGVIGQTNTGRGVVAAANGTGIGLFANSSLGISAQIATNNLANANPALQVNNSSTGTGVDVNISNATGGRGVAVTSAANGAGAHGVFSQLTAATGTNNAVRGEINSADANAWAVVGQVNSAAPGANSAGVRGINNSATGNGIGVWGSHAGSGWGVFGFSNSGQAVRGTSPTGIAAQFDNAGAARTVVINSNSTNDALEVNNPGGGLGIDLNGGALDGDNQGNALGDGSANQQLTVRGSADAVIGNTLAGNPTVWDLVVQGDAVTTGLVKVGGSMWLDGTSATHQLNTNAPLLVATSVGNIEIDAAGGTTVIDDNLIVTGTSDLQGAIFNSGGAVTINDVLTQTGGGQVTFSGNVDANNGLDVSGNLTVTGNISNPGGNVAINDNVDITGHIVPTADATYDLGSNTNRWRDIYVDGASVHIGDAIGTEMMLGYAANNATLNVNGGAPEVQVNRGSNQITFDADGDGTLEAFVRGDGIGINTGVGADLRIAQDAFLWNSATDVVTTFQNTGAGDVDVVIDGELDVNNVNGSSTIGNGADGLQLTIDGAVGGVVDAQVNGDMDITGELTVGTFALTGNLDMNGGDIIDLGDIVFSSATSNISNTAGNVMIDDNLDITDALSVGTTLNVTGNSTFSTFTATGATTFRAASTWAPLGGGPPNTTVGAGGITVNATGPAAALTLNNTNASGQAINVAAGGGRTILSYGAGAGVIPQDVSVWNASGNVTLPGSTENGQVLYIVNSSGGAITVTGVTGGTAAGFNNNDVRGYVYAGGWYELP